MTNREKLQGILTEVEDLIQADEYTFDLMVHPDQLQKAHDLLWDLNTRIKAETAS